MPTSKIARMFGWFSAAVASASCSNRLNSITVGAGCLVQHFDGHVPAQLRVVGPIDLAHSAGAKRTDDFVAADTGAACEDMGGADYHTSGGNRDHREAVDVRNPRSPFDGRPHVTAPISEGCSRTEPFCQDGPRRFASLPGPHGSSNGT